MFQKIIKLLLFTAIVSLIAGCLLESTSSSENNPTTTAPQQVSTSLIATSTSPISSPEVLDQLNPTKTPLPVISVSNSPTPTTSPVPTIIPTAQVNNNCEFSPFELVDDPTSANGLVLYDTIGEELGINVLSGTNFDAPLLFMSDNDPARKIGLPAISPDNKWLAYSTYQANGNFVSLEITVINSQGDIEARGSFSDPSLLPLVIWSNPSTLIIPLGNQSEVFEWLLWEPFTDKEERLQIPMSGIGNAIENFNVIPAIDPTLSFVIYPCDRNACGEAEYLVKNLQTGEIEWSVDLSPNPPNYRGQPLWSPNGEYLAIFGGYDVILNRLWILDRQGNLIFQIALPDTGGTVAAIQLTWAPNSENLSFLRRFKNPIEGPLYIERISYINVREGIINEFCIDTEAGTSSFVWSPDSTKLALSQQLERIENSPHLITIVNLFSTNITQLYDSDQHILVGWLKP